MTDDGKPLKDKRTGPGALNEQLVLNYLDALRRGDRAAVEAALSPNFCYRRLNERFSRFEYLDTMELTILTTDQPRVDVLAIASSGNCVWVEVALEFDMQGRRLRGQYNSIYEIEDGKFYEMREYGGIVD